VDSANRTAVNRAAAASLAPAYTSHTGRAIRCSGFRGHKLNVTDWRSPEETGVTRKPLSLDAHETTPIQKALKLLTGR
jgi:hypothetical protein